jgi:hypothetical protein
MELKPLKKKTIIASAEAMMLFMLIINIIGLILVFTTELEYDDIPSLYGLLIASVGMYFLARYWCHDNPFLK